MDLYLCGEDGFSLAHDAWVRLLISVMMLMGNEIERTLELRLVADDYMVKLFNSQGLTACIYALLHRSYQALLALISTINKDHDCLNFSGWMLDLAARLLHDQYGKCVTLTLGEFSLLSVLEDHPDRIFPREQLIEKS